MADARRICSYSASYVGDAALMRAIREPGLYRCAIGRSGIYDLAKMVEWGDNRREVHGKNCLKQIIGEVQADLASRSPAPLADKVTIPPLLAHGRLEPPVDIKHARLMTSAPENNGREINLRDSPYTGHRLILAQYRYHFYARLFDFLGRNLAPNRAGGGDVH